MVVFIGVHAVILTGSGAMAAADAVVTKDVPAHAMVTGNPAGVMRQLDAETGADGTKEQV